MSLPRTPVAASLAAQRPVSSPSWDICGCLLGYVIKHHGVSVAWCNGFDEARARYTELRAHAAMSMESLKHTLEQEQAR